MLQNEFRVIIIELQKITPVTNEKNIFNFVYSSQFNNRGEMMINSHVFFVRSYQN